VAPCRRRAFPDRSCRMDTHELIETASRFVRPYPRGRRGRLRLTDFEPGDTAGFDSDDKPLAREWLARPASCARGAPGQALRQDRWAGASSSSSDACRRQGQRDQARHVGHQPAGCQVFSFKPDERGARPRLPLALHAGAAGRGRIGIFNRSSRRRIDDACILE